MALDIVPRAPLFTATLTRPALPRLVVFCHALLDGEYPLRSAVIELKPVLMGWNRSKTWKRKPVAGFAGR